MKPSEPSGISTPAAFLFLEFITGTGEPSQFFGPGTGLAEEMQSSPDLTNDKNKFCTIACQRPGYTYTRDGSEAQFGLTGITTIDKLLPGMQGNGEDSHALAFLTVNQSRLFVGSFKTTITESDPTTRLTTFTITNTTGAYSTFYHALDDRKTNFSPIGNYGGYRDNFRPTISNIDQTIMWSQINPCGCK